MIAHYAALDEYREAFPMPEGSWPSEEHMPDGHRSAIPGDMTPEAYPHEDWFWSLTSSACFVRGG